MKKLLVVLLALTFVFVMASVTLAVVTSSVDGKVEWTLKNSEQFGGSVDGKIVFDLGKDFGEGYSAGLQIKLEPGAADEAFYVDNMGWIKMVKDFGTLTFQTNGLGGNAANDLTTGYDMAGNPGVKFESTSLVEGLSLTAVVNDNMIVVVDPLSEANRQLSGNYINYLLKGVYTADALTIGAGYQMHTMPATNPAIDSAAKDAMAVWAGYKLSDALSFGLEYASRPNENGYDKTLAKIEGSTAILLKADYTGGALSVNGKVLMTTGSFYLIDPDDVGSTSAWNAFKFGMPKEYKADGTPVKVDPEDGTGMAGTAIKVDVGYQINDALKATLTVEDIMAGATMSGLVDINNEDTDPITGIDPTPFAPAYGELDEDWLLSYKLAVTDKLTEKLTLEGWYAGYHTNTEIGLKASYNFVAGLDGSLEVKSVGAETALDTITTTNSYTVTLKATL